MRKKKNGFRIVVYIMLFAMVASTLMISLSFVVDK
ncbi:stressosome-associated protein Prli42 [Paenibacillus psychroresistens]|nr:stressosome-associated protein Prli42 [Paenibacillus psychroresistens]